MRRLFTTLTAIITICLTEFSVASDEIVNYDPGRCSVDADGRVFVRLMNGQAFAFPAEDLVMLRGLPGWPDEKIENHDEPVGCPTNPLLSQTIVASYRPVVPPAPGEPVTRRWAPDLLQLITNPFAGGPEYLQDNVLKAFHWTCIENYGDPARGDLLVDASPVLQDCRIIPLPGDDKWASYLVARPGTHPEYGGRRFAVRCKPPNLAGGSRTCEARYRMRGGLGVMYAFEDADVPPEHMAAFDLQVRAFIEASRTPAYDAERNR